MAGKIFFITGTDTGVGKTVLTCLLARHLLARGFSVAAVKPLCSGGRGDARALHAALGDSLTLDEINPWHFRAPLAPLLAARREGKRVRLTEVLTHVRRAQRSHDIVLIEGAGGLLSPLGEGFNARDLIAKLRATPFIVCPNRLGAVNQALLVLEALPPSAARRTQIILVQPRRADASTGSNARVLSEFVGAACIHLLPWISNTRHTSRVAGLKRLLRRLELAAAIQIGARRKRG